MAQHHLSQNKRDSNSVAAFTTVDCDAQVDVVLDFPAEMVFELALESNGHGLDEGLENKQDRGWDDTTLSVAVRHCQDTDSDVRFDQVDHRLR